MIQCYGLRQINGIHLPNMLFTDFKTAIRVACLEYEEILLANGVPLNDPNQSCTLRMIELLCKSNELNNLITSVEPGRFVYDEAVLDEPDIEFSIKTYMAPVVRN